MTDLRALEYDSLRAAIRIRQALAPALLVLVVLGWATLTLWVFTTDVVSAATLVPLMVLAAGFEVLHALQITANGLAHYVQVAFEEPATATSPQWETTTLSYGQRFGPIGSNTLFSVLFGLVTAVNFLPAAISGTAEELVGIGIAHAVFVLRIVIASRRAARRQREDLERFRSLLSPPASTKSTPAE
jgi:hypothetical protein